MIKKLFQVFLIFFILFSTTAISKPLRICGFESGSILYYEWTLYYTLKGLEELKLVQFDEPLPSLPDSDDDADTYSIILWDWASKHNKSDKIEFIEDCFYSNHFKIKEIELNLLKLKDRINNKKDVDLLISFGTVMARFFANSETNIPYIIAGSIDPYKGKSIYSINDSGLDMVTAFIVPGFQLKQMEAFYNKFHFKTVGLLYGNSVNGRAFSGIDDIIPFLESKGVKLHICHTLDVFSGTEKEREESIISCIEKLSKETDSIYISYQVGYSDSVVKKIVEITRKYKILTSDQMGLFIKNGYLFSYFPTRYYEEAGMEYARRILMIMNGVKPRNIKQAYEFTSPWVECYNKETAKILGIDVSNEKCVY